MPGPMSAPNGDRQMTRDAETRRTLHAKGKLRTGKTAKKHSRTAKRG